MKRELPDSDIARLLEERRLSDEASAPAFQVLLTRARARSLSAPAARRSGRRLLAAAAMTIALFVAVVLLRRSPAVREPGLPAAVATLAEWKSPTDSLLHTPGAELLAETPVLVSRVPEAAAAAPGR